MGRRLKRDIARKKPILKRWNYIKRKAVTITVVK
jgi:hypothetical protein